MLAHGLSISQLLTCFRHGKHRGNTMHKWIRMKCSIFVWPHNVQSSVDRTTRHSGPWRARDSPWMSWWRTAEKTLHLMTGIKRKRTLLALQENGVTSQLKIAPSFEHKFSSEIVLTVIVYVVLLSFLPQVPDQRICRIFCLFITTVDMFRYEKHQGNIMH